MRGSSSPTSFRGSIANCFPNTQTSVADTCQCVQGRDGPTLGGIYSRVSDFRLQLKRQDRGTALAETSRPTLLGSRQLRRLGSKNSRARSTGRRPTFPGLGPPRRPPVCGDSRGSVPLAVGQWPWASTRARRGPGVNYLFQPLRAMTRDSRTRAPTRPPRLGLGRPSGQCPGCPKSGQLRHRASQMTIRVSSTQLHASSKVGPEAARSDTGSLE